MRVWCLSPPKLAPRCSNGVFFWRNSILPRFFLVSKLNDRLNDQNALKITAVLVNSRLARVGLNLREWDAEMLLANSSTTPSYYQDLFCLPCTIQYSNVDQSSSSTQMDSTCPSSSLHKSRPAHQTGSGIAQYILHGPQSPATHHQMIQNINKPPKTCKISYAK